MKINLDFKKITLFTDQSTEVRNREHHENLKSGNFTNQTFDLIFNLKLDMCFVNKSNKNHDLKYLNFR